MTLRTPPSWEQNASHPAENDRLTTQALWATTGIINPASLEVTENSPAGMSVVVADGWAAIVGTTQADMGTYVAYNDAPVTLTITSASPSQPRIDLICATINDSYYSGAIDNVEFQVIAGTPAGSPVAPALPDNSIELATVLVGAGALSITTADITDQRILATSNVPSYGDITGVTAGTGLSGGGTSGTVTVAIDTAVTVDKTTTQTLTNKTLTSPTINNGSITGAQINLDINAQTGTTYIPVLNDNGKLVTLSNTSPITVTIPTNAIVTYPIGATISLSSINTGQVTVVGDTGVTVNGTPGLKLRTQYSVASLIQIATDSWLLIGDLSA